MNDETARALQEHESSMDEADSQEELETLRALLIQAQADAAELRAKAAAADALQEETAQLRIKEFCSPTTIGTFKSGAGPLFLPRDLDVQVGSLQLDDNQIVPVVWVPCPIYPFFKETENEGRDGNVWINKELGECRIQASRKTVRVLDPKTKMPRVFHINGYVRLQADNRDSTRILETIERAEERASPPVELSGDFDPDDVEPTANSERNTSNDPRVDGEGPESWDPSDEATEGVADTTGRLPSQEDPDA